MARSRFRRIPSAGIHRPHGSSWALARGVLHALAPDPAAPGPLRSVEREAGFHLQARHAVALGSGAIGLTALLESIALPTGGRVLLPALAPPWAPEAVREAGQVPVTVDVDPDSLHLDLGALQAAAAEPAAAVLVAHTAGVPCDLDATQACCEALGLPLVELFGMAVGARWRARPVGAHATAGVAALDCGLLSAFGGALVVSDHAPLAGRLRASLAAAPEPSAWGVAGRVASGHLRALLAHPSAFTLLHRAAPSLSAPPNAGARMHPAQAEALRTALAEQATHLDARRERAAELRWALPGECWRQSVPDGALPAWSQLLVRSDDHRACIEAARAVGVQLDRAPLTDLSDGRCPHAAHAAATCLGLPCHPGVRTGDIQRVSAAVEGWLV